MDPVNRGKHRKKKAVVITGVSTGIGLATTRVFIEHGFHVFGSVRKQADADRLLAQFGSDFSPLVMDVTDEAAVRHSAAAVGAYLRQDKLAGLVNNAGIAVSGPLLHLSLEQLRCQLEVNVIAPLLVTQTLAPLLGTDASRTGPAGRVVNISSLAGRIGIPFLGAYVASKHALEGLSETLRRELMLYGIDVILVAPGAVATPIWDKAEAEDVHRFRDTDYGTSVERFSAYFIAEGRRGFTPERISKLVLRALTVPRPRARYAVVPQKFKNWTLPRLLPRRTIDRLIAKQFGMRQSAR